MPLSFWPYVGQIIADGTACAVNLLIALKRGVASGGEAGTASLPRVAGFGRYIDDSGCAVAVLRGQSAGQKADFIGEMRVERIASQLTHRVVTGSTRRFAQILAASAHTYGRRR
jgi:hypothetical protein